MNALIFTIASLTVSQGTPEGLTLEDRMIVQQEQDIDRLNKQVESMAAKFKEQEEANQIQFIYYKILFFRSSTDPDVAKKIAQSVYRRSKEFGVDPDLTLSIMRTESYFNPRAVSYMGARGLMQIMPMWIETCGKNLFDVDTSVKCGLTVLTQYAKLYNGNVRLALVAYNIGPESVEQFWKNKMPFPKSYLRYITKAFGELKSIQRPFDIGILSNDVITLK